MLDLYPRGTMRDPSVLIVHNSYVEAGGEDGVVSRECSLLESAGHRVLAYRRHNKELETHTWLRKATLPFRAVWARDTSKAIEIGRASCRERV